MIAILPRPSAAWSSGSGSEEAETGEAQTRRGGHHLKPTGQSAEAAEAVEAAEAAEVLMAQQIVNDGFTPANELRIGRVESSVVTAPTAFSGLRAILWLPDPEQRHGWREFYVYDPPTPKPGGRAGF